MRCGRLSCAGFAFCFGCCRGWRMNEQKPIDDLEKVKQSSNKETNGQRRAAQREKKSKSTENLFNEEEEDTQPTRNRAKKERGKEGVIEQLKTCKKWRNKMKGNHHEKSRTGRIEANERQRRWKKRREGRRGEERNARCWVEKTNERKQAKTASNLSRPHAKKSSKRRMRSKLRKRTKSK